MFTKIGPNAVTSDEGYTVKRTKRYEIIYTFENRAVKIEVEPGESLAVYKESFTEWDNNDEVSQMEKNTILSRVGNALSFLNTKYEIE